MTRPAVSVIVLSRNHWAYTAGALQSLGSTTGIPFETVVVDNGSSPQVCEALRKLESSPLGRQLQIRCEFNDRNAGVASGRNIGAQLAEAELLLFLDNDVEVIDPSWLSRLVAVFDRTPTTGVVGGVLVNADSGRSIQFCGGRAGHRARISFDTRLEPGPPEDPDTRETDFALGACLMTPKLLFRKSEGFDPAFDPMDYEDVDYCLRLGAAGYPTRIALASKLLHHGHVTTGGNDFNRLRNFLVKGRLFSARWDGHLAARATAALPAT